MVLRLQKEGAVVDSRQGNGFKGERCLLILHMLQVTEG